MSFTGLATVAVDLQTDMTTSGNVVGTMVTPSINLEKINDSNLSVGFANKMRTADGKSDSSTAVLSVSFTY